jgi:hypothetical protein
MNKRPTLSAADVIEALAGLVLIVSGVGSWSVPAAMIVAGVVLLVLGVTGRRIV